jgi:hypothetical protein
MPAGALKHIGEYPITLQLHTDVLAEHHRARGRRSVSAFSK